MRVPGYIIPCAIIEIGAWGEKQIKKASAIRVEEHMPCGEMSKNMSLQEWITKHKIISSEEGKTVLVKPMNVSKDVLDKVVSISWLN